MITTPHAGQRPIDVPAVIGGVVGLALLTLGVLWSWFTGPGDPIGALPSPMLLWGTLVAAAIALAAGILRLPAAITWVALGVAIALGIAAALGADPSWMCWDGIDEDGNMVGGCEEDEWSYAPALFGAGLLLVALAIVRAALARRRA